MVFPREQFLGAITELDENQSGIITCNDAIITEVIGYQGTARSTQPVGSSGIGIFWVEDPGGGNPTLAKFTNSNNQTVTISQNNISLDGYASEADLLAHTIDTTIHFTAASLNLDGYALISDIPILNINLDGYALEADLLAHTTDATIHFTAESLGLDGYALGSNLLSHTGNTSIHFTAASLNLDGYALGSNLLAHTNDSTIHFTAASLGLDGYALTSNLLAHTGNTSIHFTAASLGLDGYALTSDIITDHGNLTGLADDDHTQYLLINGTRAMTGDLNIGSNDINNCISVNSPADNSLTLNAVPSESGIFLKVAGVTISYESNKYREEHARSLVVSNIAQLTSNSQMTMITNAKKVIHTRAEGNSSVMVQYDVNYTF